MSIVTLDSTAAVSGPAVLRSKADARRIAALSLLSIRFIQGFIYWGGGSRRFIYAPAKLAPNAANWMANKFQSAMPGALLGTDHIIAFLLHHFYLLYASLILFSAAELIAGLFLMTGFLTRVAALIKADLNPDKLSHAALAAELTNHLVDGVILIPGAGGTLLELQQVGFHYA